MDIILLENPKETEKHFAPPSCENPLFYLFEYGKTQKNSPCYQLRMDSPIACLQYVISGTGTIVCNGNVFEVEEGDTFLLSTGKNQIYYSHPDNCFERIWINFKGTLAENLLKLYEIEDQVVFKRTNTFSLLKDLHNVCQRCTDPKDYQRETALSFFKITQFLAEHKTKTIISSTPIEKVRFYISQHIMEKITLSTLAKQFFFTEEHLIRTFKKSYGITPHQYILKSKLRIAMIMLRTTKDSIEEISYRLNFSDSRHFSAQFKKHIGIRPLAYRNVSLKKSI